MILLKIQAVKEAGGLFDPAFFLYYEDTDLFLRLKKAGYGLLLEPRARAIHHFDQCAQDKTDKKRNTLQHSARIFMEKHAGQPWMKPGGPWKSLAKIPWPDFDFTPLPPGSDLCLEGSAKASKKMDFRNQPVRQPGSGRGPGGVWPGNGFSGPMPETNGAGVILLPPGRPKGHGI